jgi:putative MATE family efflux protein
MNGILRYASCEHLSRNIEMKGPLPSTREVYKNALNVAWPSAAESVLVSLVGSIDTMMVGGLGPIAIAAVGLTNQPKFVLLALIMSLNVGVTTVVARRKGQQNREGAQKCLRVALMISFGLSLILSILGYLFAEPIMQFSGAQPDVMADSVAYFRIIMIGFVPMCIGLTINAAQRGVGNTRISMTTNMTSNIINLIFNYLLIHGNLGFPKLEVKGAALATILGSTVACLLSIRSVLKADTYLKLSVKDRWRMDRETLGSIWKISSSAVVEQLFMRFGFFTYVKVVANLGTVAFATHQICMNIINLSFAFGDGFSIAIASLVGQSLGAKRPDMAKLYVKVNKVLLYLISGTLSIIFIVFRYQIVSLFTKDAAIIAEAGKLMLIIAATTVIQTSGLSSTGCLRGAGDAKYIARTAFISIAVVRPLSAWILCYPVGLGLVGAWLSFFIDQSLRCILNGTRFRKGKWAEIVV